MADNSSVAGGWPSQDHFAYRPIIVQVLVVSFLCINLLLIVTFFSKDFFYRTTRYILFAVTLMSDSSILIVSDILLILNHFRITMQVGVCSAFYMFSVFYTFVTPVTLTAMTLERYVAICMPLRHAELCSIRSTLHCILIIHGLSSVPCIVILSCFFGSSPKSFYAQYRLCSMEMFVSLQWQSHIKLAVYQCNFFIMSTTIIFSYIEIAKVAKAASGENKKSTWRGLRTVILHAFQMLLCLVQLWCPFVEAAVFKVDIMLYINIRFYNYITFFLAPRCLSPLIYGLRDDKFFLALKYNVSFGFRCLKNNIEIGFV